MNTRKNFSDWLVIAGLLGLSMAVGIARLYAAPANVRALGLAQTFSGTATVTTLDTELIRLELNGQSESVTFEVINAGPGALTECAVEYLAYPGSTWRRRISGADWAAGIIPDFCSTVVPNTLASGAAADATIPTFSAYALRIILTSASTSDVTVRGTVDSKSGD